MNQQDAIKKIEEKINKAEKFIKTNKSDEANVYAVAMMDAFRQSIQIIKEETEE